MLQGKRHIHYTYKTLKNCKILLFMYKYIQKSSETPLAYYILLLILLNDLLRSSLNIVSQILPPDDIEVYLS